jgi:NADH-ubiquinone oxidoreductase chain 1
VGVLVRVAFLTLYERRILGYIQLRKGPNKLGVGGLFQPFRDAVKLFVKERASIFTFDFAVYYFCPVLSITLMLVSFSLVEWKGGVIETQFNILLLFCLLGMGVYPIFGSGWASNSKYALLGGIRAIAQTISYEVVFSLILLVYLVFLGSFNFNALALLSFVSALFVPLILFWGICVLAELNRTPFDFAEGERELVSGFNIEYSSFGFAIIFIAEYGFILFLSLITYFLFFNVGSILAILSLIAATLILVARGSFPRYRYDKLIYLSWKTILPAVLNYLIFAGGGIILIVATT